MVVILAEKYSSSFFMRLTVSTNSNRHFLLNLQYPLHTFLSDELIINIIVIIFMLIYLILFFMYRCERSDNYQNLLEISFLAVISLFPFYHRNYEAAILVFPLSYGILMTSLKSDKFGKIILLTMCPFMIPGPALLLELDKQGYIPSALAKSLLWQTIIIPHQVWLLFILSFLLIFIMSRKNITTLNKFMELAKSPSVPAEIGPDGKPRLVETKK